MNQQAINDFVAEGVGQWLTAEEAEAMREAVANKQRLDWLEQRVHGTGETLSMGGACSWGINIGRKRVGTGNDLREAIDAAMAASQSADAMTEEG